MAGTAVQPQLELVQVTDVLTNRVRRPLDLLRLCALALLLAALWAVATVGSDTIEGANQDVTRIINHVPRVLIHLLSTFGTFGALALLIAFAIREVVRMHPRRLVEGLLAGSIAIGLVGLLDLAISHSSATSLHRVLTQAGTSTTVRPLDAYLAALFAFVVVLGVAGEPLWQAVFWILAGSYVISAFTATQASLLSLLASPAIGALVAVLARYMLGSPNVAPDAHRIAEELHRRGLYVTRLERVAAISGEHRSYLAATADGQRLRVQVFDRDLIASGAVNSAYRQLRLRAEVALPPALSLEQVAARRALLGLAAQAAQVRVARFIAGVSCGPETTVLVYEHIATDPLLDPTDEQLAELWDNLGRLHHNGITHRGLTAQRLLADADGQVVLPILADGEPFASELRIRLDRAPAAGGDRATRRRPTSRRGG